jgi:hypothetical protein
LFTKSHGTTVVKVEVWLLGHSAGIALRLGVHGAPRIIWLSPLPKKRYTAVTYWLFTNDLITTISIIIITMHLSLNILKYIKI